MNISLYRKYLGGPDFERDLTYRLERLQLSEQNPVERVGILYEIQNDPLLFIKLFGMVYEPRLSESPDVPFFLFPYQKDLILRMYEAEEKGEDLLVEKTRDMGVTWVVLWYILWKWLTRDKWYCLIGSRKEEEVDNKAPSCYSQDTEILTRKGWKLFSELSDTDEVATRNPKTHAFQWQRPLAIEQSPYSGEMYRLHSRTLDLLVTPNHRILYKCNPWELIRGKYQHRERIAEAKYLYRLSRESIRTIPSTSIWEGTEIQKFVFRPYVPPRKSISLRKNGKIHSEYWLKGKPEIAMKGDDFCAFMGMFLSEGSVNWTSRTKKRLSVRITQYTKSKGFQPYKEALTRIFGKEPFYSKKSDWILNYQWLARYLQRFGKAHEKFIPDEIMNASKRQIEIFLHYFLLGDGSFCKRTNQLRVFTTSKRMADQFQELIQKVGLSSSVSVALPKDGFITGRFIPSQNQHPLYYMSIRKSKFQSFRIKKEFYLGKVWCVSVPNGIVYVRRNGKPVWCGNSLYGKLRYGFYSLPPWIRPANFRKSDHDVFKKLINPQRESYIEGESANPFFGRGKRVSFLFLDELFFWKFARESWRSSTDTSPCRIAVSTAKASSFARALRDSFAEQNRLITLDWKMHPFKDEEWFKREQERRKADPLSVEAELEIKYLVDPTLAYYPEVQTCPSQDIDYDHNLPLYLGLDFGIRDKTAIVYVQRNASTCYVLDAFERSGKPFSWYLPFIKQGLSFKNTLEHNVTSRLTNETFILRKADYLPDDLERIERFNSWRQPSLVCGEVAHRMRMMKSNTSLAQELLGVGVYLRINDFASSHEIRRKATKAVLAKTVFSSKYGAGDLYDALENAHYPALSDSEKPKHDETADLRAAFENFCANIESVQGGIKEMKYRRV